MLARTIHGGREGSCACECRITAVAAGLNHTVALTVVGDIFMCGHNKHGALGLGDTVNRFLPTKVNLQFTLNNKAVCTKPPCLLRLDSVQAACVSLPALLCLGGFEDHLVRASPLECMWCDQVDLSRTVAMTGKVDQAGVPGMQLARGVQVACGGMHTLALVKIRGQIIVCAAGTQCLHPSLYVHVQLSSRPPSEFSVGSHQD